MSLTCALSSAAQIPIAEAIEVALKENPEIQTLRGQEEALNIRSRQVLAPQSPSLFFTRTGMRNYYIFTQSAIDTLGVQYNLSFPGKAIVQSRAVSKQARAAEANRRQKELEIRKAVESVFSSLFFSKRRLELLGEAIEGSEGLIHLIEKKYSVAQASQVDLLNARASLGFLKNEEISEENKFNLLKIEFRTLLRRMPDEDIEPQLSEEIPVPEKLPHENELLTMLRARSAKLRSADLAVESSEHSLTSAKMAALPDFQFSFGINKYYSESALSWFDLQKDYTFTVTATIPLFALFNEIPGVSAARRDTDVARASAQKILLDGSMNVSSLARQFNTLTSQAENLTSYVVPSARSAYQISMKSYALGKADYLRLKESLNTWINSQRNLFDVQSERAKLVNDLSVELGCDLSSRGGEIGCQRS